MEAESTFRRIARQRWPGWGISGDGEYALVCPDNGRVILTDFPIMLADERAKNTMRRFIRMEPRQSKPAGRRSSSNNNADRERD